MNNSDKTLIVIGGGAAGFFCAVNAARLNPELRVCIIEKTTKLLSKVKVSGGGRCNVTHACFDIAELVKKYPRGKNFLKRTFYHFNTQHTIEWFAERGITLKTETDGRMFPITNSSQTIIDGLLQEANKYGVEILMNREVQTLEVENHQFQIFTGNDEVLQADYVCITCGGYSKITQFNWIKALGHSIEEPRPSLFTFNVPGNDITQLMGISVEDVTVKINDTKLVQAGPLLITHWGLSGPAILKLSAWGARILAEMNYQFSISINWLGTETEQNLREKWLQLRQQLNNQQIQHKNPFSLPNRLWLYLLSQASIHSETRWSDLSAKTQSQLIKNLTVQVFIVSGKTTFKEEFVTCGGIQLSEIDANTMQSKLIPNLFFAGEVMNVDGVTGGFNFQHAWTSGWIAAKAIAANS